MSSNTLTFSGRSSPRPVTCGNSEALRSLRSYYTRQQDFGHGKALLSGEMGRRSHGCCCGRRPWWCREMSCELDYLVQPGPEVIGEPAWVGNRERVGVVAEGGGGRGGGGAGWGWGGRRGGGGGGGSRPGGEGGGGVAAGGRGGPRRSPRQAARR